MKNNKHSLLFIYLLSGISPKNRIYHGTNLLTFSVLKYLLPRIFYSFFIQYHYHPRLSFALHIFLRVLASYHVDHSFVFAPLTTSHLQIFLFHKISLSAVSRYLPISRQFLINVSFLTSSAMKFCEFSCVNRHIAIGELGFC